MKRRFRVCCLLLAVFLLGGSFGILGISAEAEEKVVYVSDAGGIYANETVFTSVNDAISEINNAVSATCGRIVLVGDFTVSGAALSCTAHTKQITFTSITSTDTPELILEKAIILGGPMTFENLIITSPLSGTSNKERVIYGNGKSLVMGKNLTMNGWVTVSGGTSGGACSGTSLEIHSGTYYRIYAMGVYGGPVNGNVSLAIHDGEVTNDVFVGGLYGDTAGRSNTVSGKTTVTLNGGSYKNIYIGTVTNTTNTTQFTGEVVLDVNGGSISGVLGRYNTAETVFTSGCKIDFSDFKQIVLQNAAYSYDNWYEKVNVKADTAYTILEKDFSVADFAGYQVSLPTSNSTTYNIRLLSVLSGTNHTGAGYTVKASYNGQSQTFEKSVSSVYTSVVASSSTGQMKTVTAEDLGGDYILALTVSGIPVNEGPVTFTVQPYLKQEGVLSESVSRTFTYDPVNGAYNEIQSVFQGADALKTQILTCEALYSDADVSGNGKCYYVSYSEGNDSNTGLSPEDAWQTIDQVSRATLAPGSVVLFKRGDEWRLDSYAQSGKATYLLLKTGVTYSSYGVGAKPVINGSPVDAAKEGTWTLTSTPNVWQYSYEYNGMSDANYNDVGNIFFNGGEFYGLKMLKGEDEIEFTGIEDLDEEFEFWYNPDDHYVYLYCDQNPKEKYASIEMGVRLNLVRATGVSDVIFDNFTIKNGGAHGISMVLSDRVTVTNCEVGWIGGGVYDHSADSPARYGNGIEINQNCNDIVIRNNYIYQCYDAGLTHQFDTNGDPSATIECIFDGITYQANVVRDCFYGIEYFVSPARPDVLVSGGAVTNNHPRYMQNINILENYILYSGYGWGYWRPASGQPGAAHIKAWNHFDQSVTENSIAIQNNSFAFSKYDVIYAVHENAADIPTVSENIFIQDESGKGIILQVGERTAGVQYYSIKDVPVGERSYWNAEALKTNPYLKDQNNTFITTKGILVG